MSRADAGVLHALIFVGEFRLNTVISKKALVVLHDTSASFMLRLPFLCFPWTLLLVDCCSAPSWLSFLLV